MILDCSIVMAWFFADESSEYADDVARQLPDQMAYVPSNWPLEVANTLIMGERRKRSTQTQAARLIKNLAALPITVDEESNLHAWNSTLSLAREQNLTAYDAAYLELAMRRGLPLATLDDKLKAAATAVGVPLFGLQ
ncbi:type II toxin-antitoxin system VapC family toxin [Singulisphaera acidiphila]|nr:type II toxin-antitoxin system VapC family toxin [Singulisphaera acidiphila]